MTGVRLNVWSGPRNVSTALMYSFRQRSDTTVVDEPLYGHYLHLTGADHPGRDDLLEVLETDGERVVQEVILGDWADTPVVMFKQMAHHLVGLDRDFLDACRNVLLIRDPREVLLSYVRQVEAPTLEGLGYPQQVELLDRTIDRGEAPVVVDARQLLRDPEGQLTRVCEAVGIGFDPAMLSWPAGPKPEDGAWADHWYDRVRKTTGFAKHRPKPDPVPDHLEGIHQRALPLYERLLSHAN